MAMHVINLVRDKLMRLLAEGEPLCRVEEEQARSLVHDLHTIMENLRRLEKRSMPHHVTSLAELAHNANDSIDAFIETASRSRGGLLRCLDDIWKEVQPFNSRISADLDEVDKNGSTAEGQGPPRIREEELAGLEGEVRLLLNKLIPEEGEEESPTLCVMGMGGVGKTTLASMLYNHPAVVARFEKRFWLNLSPDGDIEEQMMELVRVLGIQESDVMKLGRDLGYDESTLMELVRVMRIEESKNANVSNRLHIMWLLTIYLTDKKYFIVLDDVGSFLRFEFSQIHFPAVYKSRVVMTVRSKELITRWTDTYFHEMKSLDASKSWELFLKKVFPTDLKCPKNLERIGRQIVRKCDGLPLAIQEAGTKLTKKTQSESVWQEFLETMDLSETLASLELSYLRLQPLTKSFFLGMAFFKEGTTIRVDKFVQVWLARGMSNEDGKTTSWHLQKMVQLYMAEVKDLTRDNNVKSYCINYNLHRLAIMKAKEEVLFEVINNKTSHYQPSYKPRHRVMCHGREMINYSNENKHLVSLFFHGGGNFDASPSYWKSFELLKILDFEAFGLKTIPEMVATLITLKYLGLRNNFIQELPRSLGLLRKLEVLDIAENFMIQVPDIIWKMDYLRHIYMSDIICREPLKIDKLCELQTLIYIPIDKWTYEVSNLKTMTSLCKLGIEVVEENSQVTKLFESLADLEKLKHLILKGFRFRSMPELDELHILQGLKQLKLEGLLSKLPSANNFPPNINYLSLSNSRLHEDPMSILEKLPKLIYLKLRNAFTGEEMAVSCHGFVELRILCIEELWHLKSVTFGKGAMEQLARLEIRSCSYLKTLPQEIGFMSRLAKLKIVTTKKIAAVIRKSSFISKIRQVDIQP